MTILSIILGILAVGATGAAVYLYRSRRQVLEESALYQDLAQYAYQILDSPDKWVVRIKGEDIMVAELVQFWEECRMEPQRKREVN